MNAVVKGSVGLAIAVGLVSVLFFAMGLHANPMMGLASIGLFIVLNVGAVFWVLSQTAAESGYGKQLLNGLLLGLIAGGLIFVFSWLTQSVLFPNSLDEWKDGYVAMLENAAMAQEQKDVQIAKIEEATVMGQAISGLIGTAITSVVIAAIVAIFKRRK